MMNPTGGRRGTKKEELDSDDDGDVKREVVVQSEMARKVERALKERTAREGVGVEKEDNNNNDEVIDRKAFEKKISEDKVLSIQKSCNSIDVKNNDNDNDNNNNKSIESKNDSNLQNSPDEKSAISDLKASSTSIPLTTASNTLVQGAIDDSNTSIQFKDPISTDAILTDSLESKSSVSASPNAASSTSPSKPLTAPAPIGYKRLLSYPEITMRYSIDAPADEALKDTQRILAGVDGSLSLNAKVNYAIVLENLIADDSTVTKIKGEVLKVPDNIYSITSRGLRLNEIQMDDLLTDILKFGTLKYLCELDLSYNNLSYASLAVLYNSLDISKSGFCPIKRLFLTRCCMGTRGVALLWKAIKGSVFIEEVIVNGNFCGDDGIVGIKDVLTFRDCRLTELAIGDNNLSINSVQEIADGIAGNSSLKGLQLQQNPFGDEGLAIIYQCLNVHPGVENLNLSGCDLKNCSWAENLRISVKLTALYLNNNLISDRGFRAVCDTLNSCFSLRHLDLSNNLYNGRLCMALGPAIRANKGLLSLSIAGNKIEVPDVWVSIKLGLLENKTLLKFDLSYCEIKLENAKIICSAFAVNVTCDINLDFNPLPLALTLNPRAYEFEEKNVVPMSRRARLRASQRVIQMDFCQTCVNLPLSPDAPGIALRESLQWRNGMLIDLQNAKEALSIIDDMGLNMNDERDRITKINPLAAEAKRITTLRDLVDFNVDKFSFGKKQLGVFYGYESQYLGYIDINDSTTYEQVKELVKPLVRDYFPAVDAISLADIINNFKILDHNGEIVEGSNAKMRTVWQEALLNECKLFIRPSNWIFLPKGEEDGEEEDDDP